MLASPSQDKPARPSAALPALPWISPRRAAVASLSADNPSACRGSSEVGHPHTNANAAGTAPRENGRQALSVFANSKALANKGAVGVLARLDRIMAAPASAVGSQLPARRRPIL